MPSTGPTSSTLCGHEMQTLESGAEPEPHPIDTGERKRPRKAQSTTDGDLRFWGLGNEMEGLGITYVVRKFTRLLGEQIPFRVPQGEALLMVARACRGYTENIAGTP
jgi:hypothetical protein